MIIIIFIILCFLSLHLLIFIKTSKAKILMLNLIPVLFIIAPLYFNDFKIGFFQADSITYLGLFLIPHANAILLLNHSFLEKNSLIRAMDFIIIPFLILFLVLNDYRLYSICAFHLTAYFYLFLSIRKKLFEKKLIAPLVFNSIFIILYLFKLLSFDTFIMFFAFSFLLYYFIMISGYTKKLITFANRFAHINLLNKNLNQRINRLRQSSEQLKRIIAQKDIELLQVARHASLAEVTTGIAHELAQPLTGIKCIAQNLVDDISCNDLDMEQTTSDLEKISSLVDRSSSIIDHIRSFSRKRGFSLRPVDINTCILNSIDLINNQMKKNSIDVIFILDDTIPKIWGDNLALEQLFINLILNSKDAILSKQDEEPYLSGFIKITTTTKENQVILILEDNGNGIPEDIITKIWTPFFTTKLKGKGTGIGLSLSHRIIKEHNAEVLVNTSARGTVFTIRFSIDPPNED